MILKKSYRKCFWGNNGTRIPSGNQGDWYLSHIVINNTTVTQYELWVQGGVYSLNPYTYTWNYTISGNKLISDDGQEATVSINGNSMTVTANGQVMKYTKYDGTPQQLIDYLNKK